VKKERKKEGRNRLNIVGISYVPLSCFGDYATCHGDGIAVLDFGFNRKHESSRRRLPPIAAYWVKTHTYPYLASVINAIHT
jgi:hypothetical protein